MLINNTYIVNLLSFLLITALFAKENNNNKVGALKVGFSFRIHIKPLSTVVENALTNLAKDISLNFRVKRTMRLMKRREMTANTTGLVSVEVPINISDTDISRYFIIITIAENKKFNSITPFQPKLKADLHTGNHTTAFFNRSTFSFVSQNHF